MSRSGVLLPTRARLPVAVTSAADARIASSDARARAADMSPPSRSAASRSARARVACSSNASVSTPRSASSVTARRVMPMAIAPLSHKPGSLGALELFVADDSTDVGIGNFESVEHDSDGVASARRDQWKFLDRQTRGLAHRYDGMNDGIVELVARRHQENIDDVPTGDEGGDSVEDVTVVHPLRPQERRAGDGAGIRNPTANRAGDQTVPVLFAQRRIGTRCQGPDDAVMLHPV